MTYAWFIFSVILGCVWLVVFCMGTYFIAFNGDGDRRYGNAPGKWTDAQRDDWRVFSAIMAGALLVVVFHWILIVAFIVLVIPVFVVYGFVQGIRLMIKRPWKKVSKDA